MVRSRSSRRASRPSDSLGVLPGTPKAFHRSSHSAWTVARRLPSRAASAASSDCASSTVARRRDRTLNSVTL